MLREDFERLVVRLEAIEKHHPQRYRWGLVLLISLGYLYLVVAMFLGAALALGAIALATSHPNYAAFKLAFWAVLVGGGASWAIVRALWVRIPAPEGLQLTHAEVPELFSLIDRICEEIGTPRPHEVLLVPQYNACVTQVPRLGVFGWYRAYLLLGLPLMQNLSAEEFTAVLAHEFGHLSRSHCRFGGWIYRTRDTWERVMTELFRRRNFAARALQVFLRWFWPAFNARAFVLARSNEYEADRCSVKVAGATPAGQALVRLNVYGPVTEQFWADVDRLNQTQVEPPADILRQLGSRLAGPVPQDQARRSLDVALRLTTHCADTHPCLRDRLKALGVIHAEAGEVSLPSSPQRTAAEVLLAGRHAELCARLDRQWAQRAGAAWTARHEQAIKSRQELAVLCAKPPQETTVEDLWTQIKLRVDLDGDGAAQSAVDAILSREPEHPGAAFIRGRHLLAQDDAGGIEWLTRAMKRNPHFTEPCVALIQAYHAREGSTEQVRQLNRQLDQHDQQMEIAQKERSAVTVKDRFTSHGLSETVKSELCQVFASEPDIVRACVARKVLTALPNEPMYVIALELQAAWWRYRSEEANQLLVKRVLDRVKVQGWVYVFTAVRRLKPLGQKIGEVPGSLIYEKP
jgi:Zn-dependent protease with chaperone function